jgi:uncharacterized protein YqfB (UPF0267 family)
VKLDETQTLVDKGFETLVSGMRVLESHQVHLSKQISDIKTVETHSNSRSSQVSASEPVSLESSNQEPQPAATEEVSHPQVKKKQFESCKKCDFQVYSDVHLSKHMKVKHGKKDKLLWVADSISSNVDFKNLGKETNMVVSHLKAYSVTHESEGARFPEMNFLDVIEQELDRNSYNVLVMGGGTVEITNLNTSHNPEVNTWITSVLLLGGRPPFG